MYRALESNKVAGGQQAVFSIGHVLRYSPHNMLLRKLVVQDGVIGEVLSVVHTEPVGWWHFTHSYVRGNWYVRLASIQLAGSKCASPQLKCR
jgi:predicted dehydrogenase